jgi:hypothetical protein
MNRQTVFLFLSSLAVLLAGCAPAPVVTTEPPAAAPVPATDTLPTPTEPPTDLPVSANGLAACSLLSGEEIEAVYGALPAPPRSGESIGEAPGGGRTYDCYLLEGGDGFAFFAISKRAAPALALAEFERARRWSDSGAELADVEGLGTGAYWEIQSGFLNILRVISEEFVIDVSAGLEDTPENRAGVEGLAGLIAGRLSEAQASIEVSGPALDACLLVDEAGFEAAFGALSNQPQAGEIIVAETAEGLSFAFTCLLQTIEAPLVNLTVQVLDSAAEAAREYAQRIDPSLPSIQAAGFEGLEQPAYWEALEGNLYGLHLVWENVLIDFSLEIDDSPANRAALEALTSRIIARLAEQTGAEED